MSRDITNQVAAHRLRYLTKSLDPARSSRFKDRTPMMDSDPELSRRSGSQRFIAENRVSSEYTPLLEDFTERFINRSQNTLQTSGSVTAGNTIISNDHNNSVPPMSFPGQQLPVPPELLLIHHQQSPFNPNLIASDSSSLSSISFESQVDENFLIDGVSRSPDQQEPNQSSVCSKLYKWLGQTFWLLCQTALIISLMAFNFGSVLTPQLYSAFFNPYDDQEQLIDDEATMEANNIDKNSTKNEDFRLFLINFTAMTFIQIFMSLMATVSSLILLYAACKVLHRIRKRLLFHMKHRTFGGNPDNGSLGTESSKTLLTMETVVAETMGVSLARILSLFIVVNQFCLCTIYIYILYDYSDMFLAKLPWFDISEQFCQFKSWYLNHDVVCSIILTVIVAIFFGLASLRKMQESNNRNITSLYSLWLLKIFATVIGLLAIIFVPIVIAQIYPMFQQQQRPTKRTIRPMESYHRWTEWLPIKKQNDWIALFGTLPLMLLPFQLNEILIMLIFSQYNDSYYRPQPVESDQDSEQEPLYRSITKSSSNPGLLDSPDNQLPNGGPLLYLASFKSIASSRTSFFFRSFGTVRNWFVVVAILICLLQIVLNIFYFHWTYQSQPEIGTTIEINFIREYLSAAHVDPMFVLICAAILFLKTMILYLLMLFRGVLALQGLFGSYQRRTSSTNEPESYQTRFQFITPYLIWNCLALVMALVVQYSPEALQFLIWLIGLFAIILVLLYPSMLLCYFSTKTLGQLNATNGGSHRLSVEWSLQQFRPLRWPRLFLMFGILMAAIALFYLTFWVYGYGRRGSFEEIIDLHDHFHQVPLSLVTFIRRQTTSDTLFCNHSLSTSSFLLPN